ncbi:Zn finger-containing GTPase- Activating Protein for ARF [Massospora cicadina]|nr:Zn finger-containing GTPase- Activating Protein for ARF [Massospora cicadina]
MTIEKKYTSRLAQDYREKLAAECEGKTWTPSASSETSPRISTTDSPSTSKRSMVGTATGIQRTASADSTISRNSARSLMRRNQSTNSKSSPGTPRRTESNTESGTSSPRGGNEEYFAKLGEANESRPELDTASPTSPSIPDIGDLLVDPLGTLTKGWSLLSLGASSALGQAVVGARNLNTSILQPVTERLTETVRDPELQGRVSGYVSSITRTVHDTSSKGFSYFSEYLQPQSSPQTYGHLDDEENEDFGGDYSTSENFRPYRDSCGDETDKEAEPESWKSVDHPVSGSTTSTRLGSTSMSSSNSRGSNTMQMRRGKGTHTQKDDSWGDDNEEWSKF